MIFKQGTVKLVSPAFTDRLNYESAGAAIFSRIVVNRHVQVLNGIGVGGDVEYAWVRIAIGESVVHIERVALSPLSPAVHLGVIHQTKNVIVKIVARCGARTRNSWQNVKQVSNVTPG